MDFLSERKWSWRLAIGTWVTVAFLIAAEFTLLGRGWVNTVQLADHGVRVAATVVKLEPKNHDGCRYTYSVGGYSFTKFDEDCGGNRQVGDPIFITYVPSHPSVSTAGSPRRNLHNALLISLGVPTFFALMVGSGVAGRRLIAM